MVVRLKSGDVMSMFYRDNNAYIMCENMLDTTIIEDEHVDLIITSPPYNLDISYKNSSDNLKYEDYLKFTQDWLEKCLRLAKPDGRLCVNVPLDTGKGGSKSIGSDITTIAKDVGWKYRSTIVWNKGKVNGSIAKGSYKSASAPNVIAPVELIIVFYKHSWKKITKGESDITDDEFKAWTDGNWIFPGERRKKDGHPAPFPEELPKRCIKLFSYVGDIVLDPFMGSGTTVVVANKLGRKAIGIEVSRDYCEMALDRLMKV